MSRLTCRIALQPKRVGKVQHLVHDMAKDKEFVDYFIGYIPLTLFGMFAPKLVNVF